MNKHSFFILCDIQNDIEVYLKNRTEYNMTK